MRPVGKGLTMENTQVNRYNGFAPTPTMEEIYRQVRRYYAAEDVRRVCKDLGIELDGDGFAEAVDRYDDWQGSNDVWADALVGIIQEVDGEDRFGDGVLVTGVLQDWDIYDTRFDIHKVEFYIPSRWVSRLLLRDLDLLAERPTLFHTDSADDDNSVLYHLIERAFDQKLFGVGSSWDWGDPCELTANSDDIEGYINWKREKYS